jgi:hypothetical protein
MFASAQEPSVNSLEQQELGISARMPVTPHSEHSQPKEPLMRTHHVIAIAVVAVVLVGIGAKLPFFTAPIAKADSRSINSASADVSPMHQNIKNLPVQTFHDMTLVFPIAPDGD